MVRRFIQRNRALLIICLAGGLGGIAPDIGHFLNLVTQGKVDWSFGHSLEFWAWFTGASFGGLVAALVLRKKNGLD